MRKEFSWYFRPSEDEIKEIWGKGILTVDANVLLDLYRYYESTRDSLISSLEQFKGRLWLSRQAADEFFRNRKKVIFSSKKTFEEASKELGTLRNSLDTSVNQLKGNRIIPAEIASDLENNVSPALEQAEKKIRESLDFHPNYLEDDPILERLLVMFDNAVGPSFSEEDLKNIKKEAENRRINKIPPGYLDSNKDGDRPYGDFFLWRQIIQYSKDNSLPIIFVTSERKEDWWEKHSGQTVGPRQELLMEACNFAKQRILIYQTDHFLEYSATQSGSNVDDTAVEEIRAIDTLRSETEAAVEVIAQLTRSSSVMLNEGSLTIRLRRPVYNFTCSGHFDLRMSGVPSLQAVLVEFPQSIPGCSVGAGTGTNHDFNIHIKSDDRDATLPVGVYVFEYTAICAESP